MVQEYQEELNRYQKVEKIIQRVEWNNKNNSGYENRILKKNKNETQFKMKNSHIEKEIKKAVLLKKPWKN